MPTAQDAVDALDRFWNKIGITPTCPICSHQTFNLDKGAEIHVPMVRDVVLNEAPELYRGQEAYTLYCANCGFILPFVKRVVDAGDPGPEPELDLGQRETQKSE